MRTALYMRMSTDKQDSSINSQLLALTAYAEAHNMRIVEKYIDEGISGRSAEKRPAFLEMIKDSGENMFDSVLVYDSSRFARNLLESIVYKTQLNQNGVKLISITEPQSDDDNALITDAMLGALNEMFSRKLSKSVKRGMVYKAQMGIYQTPPPFGYRKTKGEVEIIEAEAVIVKQIFKLFIASPSWHSVAVSLNGLGIKKRSGKGWNSRDIKRILQNQAYIGNVYYDGRIYKGVHKPIVDRILWEKAGQLIAHKPNGKHRPPSSYKHWLSGLLVCAYCGGKMSHTTDSKGRTSYRCSGSAKGSCEYSNFISVIKLEAIIKHALLEMVPEKMKIEGVKYEDIEDKESIEEELEALGIRLKRNGEKLERYKQAYSAGIDSLDEYENNKLICINEEKGIIARMEALYSSAAAYKDKPPITPNGLIELLFSDGHTVPDKSAAIRRLVEKIVLNKYTGEVTVFYYG